MTIGQAPYEETGADPVGVRRAVVAATIGTVIEWFDYALYGSAAGLVINQLFFPNFSAAGGMLAAFATFAVGFFARPIGGIVIAHLGDRWGRKPALLLTILLMGASTVAMGLLPTYAQLGIWAPALLILLRLAQGFGAGAEYAGAVTLVAEYAPPHLRSVLTAILQSATLVGVLLSNLAFLAVSILPGEALAAWAWRVPFLLSGALFVVALYIRNRLDETPAYVAAMAHASERHLEPKVPFSELLAHSPRELISGCLSVTGHNATAYVLAVFALGYMTNTLGVVRTQGLGMLVIATVTGSVATVAFGALAGRIGNDRVYFGGAVFVLLFAFPFFALLETRSAPLMTLALVLLYAFGFGGMAGAQGAFLADLFPTRYRFSGIALAREVNGLLIAGPTPFVASALLAANGGQPTYVALYVMACAAVTILATGLHICGKDDRLARDEPRIDNALGLLVPDTAKI